MTEIPDEFTLLVGGQAYWVRRVRAVHSLDMPSEAPAVWAFRPEGNKTTRGNRCPSGVLRRLAS